ncbi:MAG: DUF3791 domain-containing protein [Succinivibrionaceae bacterium]|nr:DUF3791 domain-containing protein [Succinivibrionaceae bacterium]
MSAMKADRNLLQMKYARIIELFADRRGITVWEALEFFYHSEEYKLVSRGVSDLHCMSDEYLVEDLQEEYDSRRSACGD